MTVPQWQQGKQYLPGDLVRPADAGEVSQSTLQNRGFETGDLTGWTVVSGDADTEGVNSDFALSGTYSYFVSQDGQGSLDGRIIENDTEFACEPGQEVTARCYVQCTQIIGSTTRAEIRIQWYTAGGSKLEPSDMIQDPTLVQGHVRIDERGLAGQASKDFWTQIEAIGTAPDEAATFKIEFMAHWIDGGIWRVDDFEVDQATQTEESNFLFRAVQDDPGFAGESEPDWPVTLGGEVTDNEVTWRAVAGNNITWEANRILVSGTSEPTWPTAAAGASVVDNTIAWELESRHVRDDKRPDDATIVVMGASKVFAANGDIINYSATVNPLDWSADQDAGYIPFGLNEYGANDITAAAIYRGNLVAFNSQGAQIWQIDEDPAAIQILDAIPVSCVWPKSVQPVGDDLAFLSSVGIRSLGVTGASINLQGGYFGKQIDPLVQTAIAEAEANGWTPRGIYWPAWGQYWLFFDDEAFVLTMNGSKASDRSWSRYVFPSTIDDWCILDDDLYLRSGDLIWKVTEDATLDDQRTVSGETVGTEFEGEIQWPHLDLNKPGQDKTLKALDLVMSGSATLHVGYDQTDQDYSASGKWTTGYAVDGDTLPGQPLPFEITAPSFALRLVFDPNQSWEMIAANLYLQDTNVR